MKGIPAGADWMILTHERKLAAEVFSPSKEIFGVFTKHNNKSKKMHIKKTVYKKKEPKSISVPFHELCY